MKTGTLTTKGNSQKQSSLEKRDMQFPFGSLRRDMNRLFDDFFHREDSWLSKWNDMDGEYFARVDVKDNDSEIVVSAELPGVGLEDIDLTVYTDHLKIQGEKKDVKETKEKGRYHMERSYGYFSRVVPIPCDIEQDKVEATYKDGILRVSLPKSKQALSSERKVEVKKE